MEHVAEDFIWHGGEKPEVGVNHPFELCLFAVPGGDDGPQGGLAPEPMQRKSRGLQDRSIRLRGLRDALFAVVKDINVAGKAGRMHVERGAAGHVALWIAMGGE
jgi:hypothetical protein